MTEKKPTKQPGPVSFEHILRTARGRPVPTPPPPPGAVSIEHLLRTARGRPVPTPPAVVIKATPHLVPSEPPLVLDLSVAPRRDEAARTTPKRKPTRTTRLPAPPADPAARAPLGADGAPAVDPAAREAQRRRLFEKMFAELVRPGAPTPPFLDPLAHETPWAPPAPPWWAPGDEWLRGEWARADWEDRAALALEENERLLPLAAHAQKFTGRRRGRLAWQRAVAAFTATRPNDSVAAWLQALEAGAVATMILAPDDTHPTCGDVVRVCASGAHFHFAGRDSVSRDRVLRFLRRLRPRPTP